VVSQVLTLVHDTGDLSAFDRIAARMRRPQAAAEKRIGGGGVGVNISAPFIAAVATLF